MSETEALLAGWTLLALLVAALAALISRRRPLTAETPLLVHVRANRDTSV